MKTTTKGIVMAMVMAAAASGCGQVGEGATSQVRHSHATDVSTTSTPFPSIAPEQAPAPGDTRPGPMKCPC